MNPLPPNVDELVSAYLDGEATSDEIAIVESTPELMSRVQTLRALSDQLGAAAAPDPEQKEAHIAAALGAFDALFATDTDQVAAPILAAVPDAASSDSHKAEPPSGVTSLTAARARRRPRRFNTGVIAAAAAAVLLFVAVAALSFGRGNDSADVATSSIDAAVQAEDAAEARPEVAQLEAARAPETTGGDAADTADGSAAAQSSELSEPAPDAAAPSEAPAAIQSADQEEADEEEAMEEVVEAEAAMADDSAGESDNDAFLGDAESAILSDELFVGTFPSEAALRVELDQLTAEKITARSRFFEPGLFPGCQENVPELAELDIPTLVAEAVVDDQPVEIHLVSTNDQGVSLVIVDAADCSIVSTIP